MCGITGAVWSDARLAIDEATLKRMADALSHRGPDDYGQASMTATGHGGIDPSPPFPHARFGFRRLSIIDLAGGHQPLTNEDDSITLVFNGEIYNYRDLRRRLEGSGHRFRSDSDSETIVHLYEDLGVDCFSRLNGMFAIAIWDSRTRRLILARDRLGKKPLFYSKQPGRLCFASELKSFAEVADLPLEIDPAAVDLYFTYQYIPHPHTIYKGIYKLEPGHIAVYENDELTTQGFWHIDWTREIPRSKADAIEEVRTLLTDAVRLRLRSDVPLGAFLSGGVDSSLIVSLAQSQLDQPIKTFSIGFGESDFDETRYAQQVADFVGTEHRRFEVNPDAASILDKLVWHYDEPFSDSSALPTWYLCEETRKHVTVALSGDGGDELFAGYDRYRALRLSQRISQVGLQSWAKTFHAFDVKFNQSKRRSVWRRAARFMEAMGQPPARRYLQWLQIFDEASRWAMYRSDFAAQLPDRDPFEFLENAWNKSGHRDVATKASLADLQTYLPCDLMTKVDIASMAHSLEARQPFLDYRLVEFAASLPIDLKFRWSRGKRLLRDAFRDEIPNEIWRRPKMGFGIPIQAWFRGPLADRTRELLLASDSHCHRYLEKSALEEIVANHQRGLRNEGYRLWSLVILETWLRRWT